jgi:hypothetical protein
MWITDGTEIHELVVDITLLDSGENQIAECRPNIIFQVSSHFPQLKGNVVFRMLDLF